MAKKNLTGRSYSKGLLGLGLYSSTVVRLQAENQASILTDCKGASLSVRLTWIELMRRLAAPRRGRLRGRSEASFPVQASTPMHYCFVLATHRDAPSQLRRRLKPTLLEQEQPKGRAPFVGRGADKSPSASVALCRHAEFVATCGTGRIACATKTQHGFTPCSFKLTLPRIGRSDCCFSPASGATKKLSPEAKRRRVNRRGFAFSSHRIATHLASWGAGASFLRAS